MGPMQKIGNTIACLLEAACYKTELNKLGKIALLSDVEKRTCNTVQSNLRANIPEK